MGRVPSKYLLFPETIVIHLTRNESGYFSLEMTGGNAENCVSGFISKIWFNEQYDEFGLVYNDIPFVFDHETCQFVAVTKRMEGTYLFHRKDLNDFKYEGDVDDLKYFEYWVWAGEAYRTIGHKINEYRDYSDVWVKQS